MINIKQKKYAVIAGIAAVAVLSGVGFYKISKWYDSHTIKFQSPVRAFAPVVITKREPEVRYASFFDPLTADQRYACDKFGDQCVVAIAIMRAESHYRPNAYNINKDGSVDLGCFQVNTVHLKQIDTSKLNLLNCKDNTDAAYQIFKGSGWNAWSTYKNGSYKQYLINK